MHVEDLEQLTAWLVKELKPICDAEPAVLAKYVTSLVRKPDKTDEEIRKFCEEQLDVFLQGNTKRFTERMFAALKDSSYMENKPSSSKPPSEKSERKIEEPKRTVVVAPVVKEKEVKKEIKEEKVEEPKATTSREVKSVPEKTSSDDRSRRLVVVRKEEPTKKDDPKPPRKRISPPATDLKKDAANRDRDVARRRSRSPPRNRRERGRRSPEHSSRRHLRKSSRSRSRTPDREKRERIQPVEERRKKRCRDYDEIGYCTRGDLCHFDHGADPVLVDRNVVDKMGPMAKGIAPNMSIPPPGYNPVNPPPPGVEGVFGAPPPNAPAVEGYNPEAPALTSANFSVPPPPLPLHMTSAPWRPTPYSVPPVPMGVSVYEPSPGVPIDPSQAAPPPVMRGGGPYRGRGRGAAQGGGPRFNPTPRSGDGKTLLVRKIPMEQNTITKLNEHFGQFGNIVNIQVRYNDDPEDALVTFTCRMEATKAIKSPEPVLNNRFIKVVWYNPDHDKNAEANGARTTLSSGVSVNKPQPVATAPVEYVPKPKVANSHEVKLFTNNYTSSREILRKKKELQIKAKSLLETQKKQAVLLDTLLKQQKKILTKLREPDMDAESKKRLHSLAKDTSAQITSAKEMTESVRKQMEETNKSLKELQEQINVNRKEEAAANGGEPVALGKRKAVTDIKTEDGAAPAKKRTGCSLMISGFTLEDEEGVTSALELTGELVDVEIQPGNGAEISAIYTFKDATSAEKVMEDGLKVNEKQLAVSWIEDKEQENTFQSTDA